DPAAGGQFSDERLVEAAAGRGGEILDARMAVTQLGLGEPARQTPILTLRVFSVDKQSKSLVEVHARQVRAPLLGHPGLCHGKKPHGAQFLQGRFCQHISSMWKSSI